MRLIFLATLLIISQLVHVVHAQEPTMTFAASTVTGQDSVVPDLSWSTAPPADACNSTGDWSGSKPPQGAEMLAPIFVDSLYNLTCQWVGSNGIASLTWTPPTQNTNGTPYTDAKGYLIVWGQDSQIANVPPERMDLVLDPTLNTYSVSNLSQGEWFFAVRAVNQRDVSSSRSNIVSKAVSTTPSTTLNRAIGITVFTTPQPPVIL